jgi:hypothetical protein
MEEKERPNPNRAVVCRIQSSARPYRGIDTILYRQLPEDAAAFLGIDLKAGPQARHAARYDIKIVGFAQYATKFVLLQLIHSFRKQSTAATKHPAPANSSREGRCPQAAMPGTRGDLGWPSRNPSAGLIMPSFTRGRGLFGVARHVVSDRHLASE